MPAKAKAESKDVTGNKNEVPNDGLEVSKPLDISAALKLRIENKLSYSQIAETLNHPKTNIYEALRPFTSIIENPLQTEAYVNNKAKLLNAVELQLLTDLTNEDKRKNASLNNVAYAYNTISTQNQLEQGKATSNVNFHVLNQSVEEARQAREAAQAELDGS